MPTIDGLLKFLDSKSNRTSVLQEARKLRTRRTIKDGKEKWVIDPTCATFAGLCMVRTGWLPKWNDDWCRCGNLSMALVQVGFRRSEELKKVRHGVIAFAIDDNKSDDHSPDHVFFPLSTPDKDMHVMAVDNRYGSKPYRRNLQQGSCTPAWYFLYWQELNLIDRLRYIGAFRQLYNLEYAGRLSPATKAKLHRLRESPEFQ